MTQEQATIAFWIVFILIFGYGTYKTIIGFRNTRRTKQWLKSLKPGDKVSVEFQHAEYVGEFVDNVNGNFKVVVTLPSHRLSKPKNG